MILDHHDTQVRARAYCSTYLFERVLSRQSLDIGEDTPLGGNEKAGQQMDTLPERYSFLLIGNKGIEQWVLVLQRALSPLGEVSTVHEEDVETVIDQPFDVIIIDAGVVQDATRLVSQLRARRPDVRLVVATASPTWRRAREALRAGATDYIRKSLDEQELRSGVQAVLQVPPSFQLN